MGPVLSLEPAITVGKLHPVTSLGWMLNLHHNLVLIFCLTGEGNLFQTAFIRRSLLLACISNYNVDQICGLPGDGLLWVSKDHCSCFYPVVLFGSNTCKHMLYWSCIH
jgi:hypothetical protein